MLLAWVVGIGMAQAGAPQVGPARVGGRVVVEAGQDDAVAELYGDVALFPEVLASLALHRHAEVAVSAGYHRDGVEEGLWLRRVPLSLVGRYVVPVGDLSFLAGLGPSVVSWAETPSQVGDPGTRGTKPGVLVELAARGGMGRAPLSAPDDRAYGTRPLTWEAALGYRWSALRHGAECPSADLPCGLDLGALRFSLGVQARY
ncbi:MAG: hypothetical protein RLZZ299_127 [Pseudomonadota bacterium]|jgi:hypothetical protein